MKKIYALISLLLIAFILFTACDTSSDIEDEDNADNEDNEEKQTEDKKESSSDNPSNPNKETNKETNKKPIQESKPSGIQGDNENPNEIFTDKDVSEDYEEDKSVEILLNGDTVSCESEFVTVDGSTITITSGGTYIVSGTLNDGSIIVNTGLEDKPQIVLKNANITSKTSAAIYVAQAKKVFITLDDGTQNKLSNGGEFAASDPNIDAALFSKDDIVLNGSGVLTVNSPVGHGISAKDDLIFSGGSYAIIAALRGVDANNSISINNSAINISSGKDGMKAEHLEDVTKGYVYIQSGNIKITAKGDGISASSFVEIDNVNLEISTNSSDELISLKGIKAKTDIILNNGIYNLSCKDDTLHADNSVNIYGGDLKLASQDDALNGKNLVYISDGEIKVSTAKDGITSKDIEISGGKINLTVTNDAIAAEGFDLNGNPADNATLLISDGEIFVDAIGDCIQVKGDLFIEGGETFLHASPETGSQIIKFTGEGKITGGTIVALGSSQLPTLPDSSNGVINKNFSSKAKGTMVILEDINKTEIFNLNSKYNFSVIYISSDIFVKNSKCYLTIGSSTVTCTTK